MMDSASAPSGLKITAATKPPSHTIAFQRPPLAGTTIAAAKKIEGIVVPEGLENLHPRVLVMRTPVCLGIFGDKASRLNRRSQTFLNLAAVCSLSSIASIAARE